jgi:hypothetical protein
MKRIQGFSRILQGSAMTKLIIALLIYAALPLGVVGQEGASKPNTKSKTAQKSEAYSASTAAKTQFMRESGYRNGRPGYVVAYRKPLACGGADDINNLEWLTAAEAKAKEKAEQKGCK